MINLNIIHSPELDEYINNLDEKVEFIQTEFGVELKSYSSLIRLALNATQKGAIDNLIEICIINKELENGLDNAGGYSIQFIGKKNPKEELFKILYHLKENLPKQGVIRDFLRKSEDRLIAVFDNSDIEYWNQQNTSKRVEIISFSNFKKVDTSKKCLLFNSFNGRRDFDFYYNLNNKTALILYNQEKELYVKCLNERKKTIEDELKSNDRLLICGINYVEKEVHVPKLSPTVSNIITRLDEMGNKEYEGYKNECDILLSEIEEKLYYKISTDKNTFFLESNDVVFTYKGELAKLNVIQIGDRIRIYPREELAENLYQIAAETEPNIFGIVEEHASFWKQLINRLRIKYGEDLLYKKLKERGLRILPVTLASYGKGGRKFPMYNNDLRAILRLYYHDRTEREIELLLKPILKSKTTYNSTMIALGRGVKQELYMFLKENKIGDILQKRNFNGNTLQNFVDEFMPIHTIISKEVCANIFTELEEVPIQQKEI